MNNPTGKLKAKLEAEAGVKFLQIDKSESGDESLWLCQDESGNTIASHRLLGKCVDLVAQEFGEC